MERKDEETDKEDVAHCDVYLADNEKRDKSPPHGIKSYKEKKKMLLERETYICV